MLRTLRGVCLKSNFGQITRRLLRGGQTHQWRRCMPWGTSPGFALGATKERGGKTCAHDIGKPR